MAPLAGQIYSDHGPAVEEILNKNVGIFLPSGDPFFKKVFDVRAGEGNNKDIGRDMSIIKTYMGTMTGVMDQGASTEDFTLYGDRNAVTGQDVLGDKIRFQNIENTFPDPTQSPAMHPFQLKVGMRSSFTSIGLTLGEMQAEADPAYIAEVINPKMMGFSRMMSHTLCSYLYLSQNNHYQLAALTTLTHTYEDADTTLVLRPSNSAIDRFEVGLRLNIFLADGTTQKVGFSTSDGTFIVVACDPLRNIVKIKHRENKTLTTNVGAGAGLTVALANDDIIVYPGSQASSGSFTGYAGLNSWIKTGEGTADDLKLLGAEADSTQYISVADHPEFKSLGKNLNGAVLTEHELRKITRLFHRAKAKYGQTVDTFLMSDGVDLKMQEQLIGRETIDRTGRLASLRNQGSDNPSEPEGGLSFRFDGRSYTSHCSSFIESGSVYGIKLANNNWKRYSPPAPKGVQKSDKLKFAPFYFVGGALSGNSGSNVLPVMKTNAANLTLPTTMVQMPGMVRMQICPDQAAGIKLTGVAETKMFSDF